MLRFRADEAYLAHLCLRTLRLLFLFGLTILLLCLSHEILFAATTQREPGMRNEFPDSWQLGQEMHDAPPSLPPTFRTFFGAVRGSLCAGEGEALEDDLHSIFRTGFVDCVIVENKHDFARHDAFHRQ